ALMAQYRVPVVVEVILERVTNISMGSELDNVTEFEEVADSAKSRQRRFIKAFQEIIFRKQHRKIGRET
ncbi:hypothetical protein ONQ87_25195, partial [Salmonella enterica subsp. enterica serovar Virginia]|nr:hypothetical protein [Salmonella enterica subsp. enterica serovar Virginia]